MHININDNWKFYENTKGLDTSNIKPKEIRIPHTVKETPFNNFDESIYQMESVYEYELDYSPLFVDSRVFITFEGVGHKASVYLNDELLGEHLNGYTSFSYELTHKLNKKNIIKVLCDSRESLNIPPFGNVIDYMTYGGIYREVYLDIKKETYLKDVYVSTPALDTLKVVSQIDGKSAYKINLTLLDANNQIVKEYKDVDETFITKLDDVTLWDLDNPYLYTLKVTLLNNEILDEKEIKFGFRTVEFNGNGFFLNGNYKQLHGLNRHQSYAYVGYAMPKSQQELDAYKLKQMVDIVRTSHYPQSHHFINKCDELGILVFIEIPGWQYVGDDDWKNVALKNVEEMIKEYRNHTSICIWGVRINESQDFHDFYNSANEIAHELDYRQTTGVRFLEQSELLEDVYSFNDFSFDGTKDIGLRPKNKVSPDVNKGYIVSENTGHIFPTKIYDHEAKRLEHALRHARVQSDMALQKDIGACISWCMFDYNTHKDFGSGDRICYHGVMDMFRNDKLAAYLYKSQKEDMPILEISSSMDIGEYNAGVIGSVYVFSNADYIRLYKNDEFVKEFKPSEKYKGLKHPPFEIDDFVGDLIEKHENMSHSEALQIKKLLLDIQKYGLSNLPLLSKLKALKLLASGKFTIESATALYNKYVSQWGGGSIIYRYDAIKDNKVIASKTKKTAASVHLELKKEFENLHEDATYDVGLISICAKDENDNIRAYYNEAIKIEVEGPIELIGPEMICLQGGVFGIYVKTKKELGTCKLSVKDSYNNEASVTFEVI